MSARLFALLVGIDAYPAPVPPLRGCVNDVTAFADVLRGRVGEPSLDLVVLTDDGATRGAVTGAIRDHLGQAGPDDVALLYYSGHGSQQRAPEELWALEPDRRNETIVLVDSRQPGQWDLADKELAVLLGEVAASGAHVLTVLDCCHSGGGTRAAEQAGVGLRLAPEDDRLRPFDTFVPGVAALVGGSVGVGQSGPSGPTTRGLRSRWSTGQGSHVLLAACRSSEKAKEVIVRGRSRGALSVALESALREHGGRLTYRQVHRYVTAGVMRRVGEQHPQFESPEPTDLDRPFLGGAVPPAPRQLTLSHLPDGWSIDSGAVHGLPEPVGADSTELAVYSLSGPTTGSPLATATVTRVLPDRSLVNLSSELDERSVFRAVVTSIPLQPLLVGVIGEGPAAAALRTAAMDAEATLLVLASDTDTADVIVRATDVGFEITRPGVSRPLVPVVRGEHSEQRTVAALEHVARWLRLSGLHNAATSLAEGALAIRIASEAGHLGDDGRIEITYAAGRAPTFTVSITNTTEQPLWCALLDLTETYGIFTDAFPSGSVALGPGESIQVALAGELSDALWQAGTVSVTDQLKVVTSTVEFDPRGLEQDELVVSETVAAPSAATRGGRPGRSTLERLLGRVTTRAIGPAPTQVQVADWRTDDLYVITTRPRP